MVWRRYPAYRDSGVAWLGDVPVSWQIRKLRECGRIFGGLTPSMDELSFWDGSIPWITPKDMKRSVLADSQVRVTEKALEETRLPIVPPNSVLLVVRGMILAKRVPIARTAVAATVNQDMKAIVPVDDIDPSFLVYLLESANEAFVPLIEEAGHGTKRLPTERWRQISFAFPAKEEQSVIVTYLDGEIVRIDALLARKERLIALLHEKRAALISRAVTKGLDTSAPMKDSGILGLAEMPAHWISEKIKRHIVIKSGQVDPESPQYQSSILIAPNHIESVTGRILFSESVDEQGAESGKYAFDESDVLYSKIRPHLRKACYPKIEGLCSADMYPLRPKERLIGDFLFYVLISDYFSDFATQESMRVAMPKINRDSLNEFIILLPPIQEQQKISEYIQKKAEHLDSIIESVTNSIEKIKEYRTALISAAVTGKIDVRGEVLP